MILNYLYNFLENGIIDLSEYKPNYSNDNIFVCQLVFAILSNKYSCILSVAFIFAIFISSLPVICACILILIDVLSLANNKTFGK